MKQAWLVGALLLNLAIVVAAALVVVQQTRQPTTPTQISEAPVEASPAPAVSAPIVISGKIIGQPRIIYPSSQAQVKEILVSVGQQIEKNSVMLVLDNPELTKRIRTAREGAAVLAGSLEDADALLKSLRQEVPQQIWTAEQKAVDARTEVAVRQEKFDKVSRIAWRLEKKARESLAASQVAEPAKLRAIIEKNAEAETLAAQLQAAKYRVALYESQSALAQLEHDLAMAEVNSQKIETLAANVQIQHMQAQQATSVLQDQEAELAALTIRAPEDGTVVSIDITPGQGVTPDSRLLTLSGNQTLYFESRIAATEASAIDPGQLAEVRVDNWPDKRFSARVVEVSRRSETTGSDQAGERVLVNIVRLEILDNSEGLLKPDMAAHTILQRTPVNPAVN